VAPPAVLSHWQIYRDRHSATTTFEQLQDPLNTTMVHAVANDSRMTPTPETSDTAPVDVHTGVEGERLASNLNHRANQSQQPAAPWLHCAMDCARDCDHVPCLVRADPSFQSSFVQSSCEADTGLHTASAEVAWEAHGFPSTTLVVPSFHSDPKQCIVNGDPHSFPDSQGKSMIHDFDGNWD
jgi:hypothetical protein